MPFKLFLKFKEIQGVRVSINMEVKYPLERIRIIKSEIIEYWNLGSEIIQGGMSGKFTYKVTISDRKFRIVI
jgi:hypothetical protein